MKRTLQDYVAFLKEGHLEEFVRYQIEVIKTMDVPLMKLIPKYTDEELVQMSMKTTISNLFDPIINGTLLEDSRKRSLLWESDKLEGGYSNRDIKVMDLVLVYAAQVRAMQHFIPQFATDMEEALGIVNDINLLYTEMRKISFQTFDNIQRKVEDKLSTTLNQLNEAQRLAHIGNFETNLITREVFWSDELYKIYGLEPDSPMPKSEYTKYVHPDDRKHLEEVINNATEKQIPYHSEYRIISEKGEHKVLEMWGNILADENGIAVKRYGALKDVTERKATEDRINKTLKDLQTAQERAHIGTLEFDLKTKELKFSDELYRIFGLEIGSPLNYETLAMMNTNQEGREERMKKLLTDKQPFEYETLIINAKGIPRYNYSIFEVITDENGNATHLFATVQDITDRKKNEEVIQKTNKQLELAQARAHIGSSELNLATKELKFSDEMYRIFGLEPDSVVNYDEVASMNTDDEGRRELLKKAIARKEPFEYETRIINKKGQIRDMNVMCEIICDKDGNPTHLFASSQDITQRKANEEKLNHTLHQLQQAQERAHIGNFEMDFKTREIIFSDELYKIYGMEVGTKIQFKELNRLNIDSELRLMNIVHAIDDKQPFQYETRITNMAGELKILNVMCEVMTDAKGNPLKITGAAQDITRRKLAEEKLSETVKQLSDSQELAHIGSWEMDLKTKKPSYSDELLRIYGFEPHEIHLFYGKLNDYIHPEDRKMSNEIYEKAVAEKASFNFDIRINDRYGALKYLYVVGEVATDDKGDGEKISCSVQDVTERKFAEEKINASIKQLKEAQELSKMGNWEVDVKTGAITWSDQLYKIYGFEPGEVPLTSDHLAQFNYEVDRDIIRNTMANAIKEKKSFNFDYRIKTWNNEVKVLNTLGEVYLDDKGEVIKLAGTNQDITERIETITELHRAEEAARAKQQFLSNMSHEIRTPMNAIIGFTKVLLKTRMTEKQKQYLDAIKVSGDTLLVLIDDILDLAKVESGKMTFERIPFDLETSISTMMLLYENKIEEKHLKLIKVFDSRIPEIVIGDPMRLHQIILNLISNAVKFTSKGKITVGIHLLKEVNDYVSIEFYVKDTGIGIPEDKLETIFEKFQQASSSTSRTYGGTGLGLAIVKQLVEAQGGTIKLESKLDEGSTFSFVLTFKKGDITDMEEKIKEEEYLEFEMKNINILVVEDNEFNQLLIKKLLHDLGCQQDVAENGKIAIEKIKENHFDLVLMDLHMPEMDGYEATKIIRNEMPSPKSQVPIIALTADVTNMDFDKCKEDGMNDYVAKPVDENILYKKIITLVSNHSIHSPN